MAGGETAGSREKIAGRYMELIKFSLRKFRKGDELFAIELTIPLNKKVFVAGTYDSETNSVLFRNSKIGLSVSYQNPTE